MSKKESMCSEVSRAGGAGLLHFNENNINKIFIFVA